MGGMSVPDGVSLKIGGMNQNFVDIYCHTDFIARFSNSGSGMLGIGTTSPAYKLDVNGDENISGKLNFNHPNNTSQIRIGASGNGVGGNSVQGEIIAIGRFAANSLLSGGGTSLVAIGYNAGGNYTSGGTSSVHVGRNSGVGITTGSFNTHMGMSDATNIPSNTSYTLHLIAGGGYEFNNAASVLSGLTTKYAMIGGGYQSATYVNDFYLGAGPFITVPSSANLSLFAPSANGTDLVGSNFTLNAGRGSGTGYSGSFIFKTSNTGTTGSVVQTLAERFRIDGPTGNVGIGTSSPSNTLHVSATTDPVKFVGMQSSTDTDLLTIDGTGVVHKRAMSSITAATNNIYTIDGTLTSTRTVTQAGLQLNFSGGTMFINEKLQQGVNVFANGTASHAEGRNNIATGNYSHVEGFSSTTNNQYSHAEGRQTFANADYSHSEGYQTVTTGAHSHSEGRSGTTIGQGSHVEGYITKTTNQYSHAEGRETNTQGDYSHAEGFQTITNDDYAHAEGYQTSASGNSSHAEGRQTQTTPSGTYGHAEGYLTIVNNDYAHAEGRGTQAEGTYSHVEGFQSRTYGGADGAHAEGDRTSVYGNFGHTEGRITTVNSSYGHAEGDSTIVNGYGAHAEGLSTQAIGNYSHSEGEDTITNGRASKAIGRGTQTDGDYQFVFGKYNNKGKLIPASMELVRLAIPRRVYTQSHIEYVIEVFEELARNKNKAKGIKIIEEPQFLRHFTAKFEPINH
jgi:hypothetical protein